MLGRRRECRINEDYREGESMKNEEEMSLE